MQPLDRVGTFRGVVEQTAVQKSSNGYPQYVMRLTAEEYFDPTGDLTPGSSGAPGSSGEPGWVDWRPYEMGGTAFLILYGSKGATLACQNLMALFGWDGRDFAALDAMGNVGKTVLFRVTENTYPQAKVRYKIDWVEDPDAPPVRELRSLDPDGLKALTAQFAGQAPPPGRPQKAAAAKAPTKPAASEQAAKPKPVTRPKPAAPATPEATIPEATTTPSSSSDRPPVRNSDEAWAAICLETGGLAEQTVAELWTEAVSFVSGGDPSKELSPEQWTQVRDDVLRDIQNQRPAPA